MTFGLDDLKNILNDFHPIFPDNISPNIIFDQFVFFDPQTTAAQLSPSTLYVTKASQLPDTFNAKDPIYFLCISDTEIPSAYAENSNAVLLLLDGKSSEYTIYNEIISAAETKYSEVIASQKLFETLTSAKTVDEIIQIASDVLENPVVYVDMGMNVISHSKNEGIDNTILNALIENSYPSSEDLKSIKIKQIFYKLRNVQAPFYYEKDSYLNYNQIFAPIMLNNTPVAVISVHEIFKPLTEKDMDHVKLISRFLVMERQRNAFDQYAKGFPYEYIIKDILDGKPGSSTVFETKMQAIDSNLKSTLYVLVLDHGNSDEMYYSMEFIRNGIENLVINSMTVIYNDLLVVILSSDQEMDKGDFGKIISFAG